MLSCRFYSEKCPKVGDIVVGKPVRVTDLCAYVRLMEYDNLEAMLTIGELSRRRIRSVNKLLKIGRTEYLQVIRVNEEKRCIDLSKSSVSEEEANGCRELYARARAINSILYSVADALNYNKRDFEELYRKTAWHLDSKTGGRKTACLEVFAAAVRDRSRLDDLDIDEQTKAILLESIDHKLKQKNGKVGAVVEVTCFERAGIDAIKDALMAGKAASTEEVEVRINLIAPPAYSVVVVTNDQEEGMGIIGRALGAIQEKIEAYNGGMKVVTKPKYITEEEEEDMEAKLAELAEENAETPADDLESDAGTSDVD